VIRSEMKKVFKHSGQKFKSGDRKVFGSASFRRKRNLSYAVARLRVLLLKSRGITKRINEDQHLKGIRCSNENVPKISLEESDSQKMISFPRVCVTSMGPNLLIQILTWADGCLLSSILLVLEQDDFDVCSVQTISLQSKVFHTILVK
ncbi:hypothetical protein KI387_025243, partial [Taxus chinensis]